MESGERCICPLCLSGSLFADWLSGNGRAGTCDFANVHGKSDTVVTVAELAIEVDRWFRSTYTPGETYPESEQNGEQYKELIRYVLSDNEALVDDVCENLPDADGYDIRDGAEAFYDEFTNYESIKDVESREREEEFERWYEERYTFQWDQFCEHVKFASRFFSAKTLLDDLFGDPSEYRVGAIRPLYNLPAGYKIYRARQIGESLTYQQLQANSEKELGPPPRHRASAGRMNVEYIPAFYAAFNTETAIAELRPGIDDHIAVGVFELQEDTSVFDFTAFDKPYDDSKKGVMLHTRYDFLSQMQHAISRPVSNSVRQRDYIPTQIVAEYLRTFFGCAGIIYASAVTKEGGQGNKNIVIFSKEVDAAWTGSGAILQFRSFKDYYVEDVIYKARETPF